jgi:predicted permease
VSLKARVHSLWRNVVRRDHVERDLDDELRATVELLVDEKVRAGMRPEEARRATMAAFGGIEPVKEQFRQACTGAAVDTLLQDIRYALRLLRRAPGFAAVIIVTLALGIGANTAIFTLIHVVMLRSLPVPAPETLVAVGDPSRPTALWDGAPMVDVLSYPLYKRLRDGNNAFQGLLASGRTGRLEMRVGDGAPELVRGRLVSGNYFDVLQVRPAIGRTFSPDEDRVAGASPVVVISDGFLRARFGRNPGILGQPIRLNGAPFTIVGVAPPGFTGEVIGSPTDIWIPMTMQAQVQPGHPRLDRIDANWLLGLGRLAPGVSLQQARAELTGLAQQALVDFAGAGASEQRVREMRSQILPVQPGGKGFSWVRKNLSALLFTLMAVVGLVLIIACMNVANLLLARATSRQREICVRLAVGASRGRLLRQLLTEGAVLALIGGIAGLLIAGSGSRIPSRLVARGGPNPVPFDVDVQPDLAVLAFTFGVSVVTAILFGLFPATRSTRVELAPVLKGSARGVTGAGWSLSKLLVVAQLALSVPLLIVAGLFVRSLMNLERLDVGYSRDNLVLLKTDMAASGYPTVEQQLARARALIEHQQSVSGVHGVAMSENGLFSGTDSGTQGLQVEGFRSMRLEDRTASFDQIGPGYFGVVGIPVLAGREFDKRDTIGAPPVALVNETMATAYFGTRSPLGKFIQNGGDWYTIVGVVKDNRQHTVKGKTERRFYLSLLQNKDPIAAWNFAIRTNVDAASLIPAIRREVQIFDPKLTIEALEPVRALMAETITGDRSVAQLSGLFGVVALCLSVAGLYGVTSYSMSRRTGEIGVRMALGANRVAVIRMVLREALTLVAVGLAIGLPAAVMVSRLTAANLTGVRPSDPMITASAILVMLSACVCAGLVPAIRASLVDPVTALRQE